MVTFKGGWGKLYYTQHTLLSNMGQLLILFFEKQTHTEGRGKEVLTQRHTTTSLKSYSYSIVCWVIIETLQILLQYLYKLMCYKLQKFDFDMIYKWC